MTHPNKAGKPGTPCTETVNEQGARSPRFAADKADNSEIAAVVDALVAAGRRDLARGIISSWAELRLKVSFAKSYLDNNQRSNAAKPSCGW